MILAKKLIIPDALVRREHLYGDLGLEVDLRAYGDLYFEENRFLDAFLYYQRAGDEEKMKQVRQRGLEAGDFNILAKVTLEKNMSLSNEEWRTAAETAFSAGKLRYAAAMFERAGDADRASEVRLVFSPGEDAKSSKT